jgi:hypothetical protein
LKNNYHRIKNSAELNIRITAHKAHKSLLEFASMTNKQRISKALGCVMSEIIFIDLNDLKNELLKLDQDLLFIQIDVHFEGSKFHKPLSSLLNNKWKNLTTYVEQNLVTLEKIEKPNLSFDPKELAVLLEVLIAHTQIIKLFKNAGIPSFDFCLQKLFTDDQMEKIICEQYKKNKLINLEYAPFAKWDKIAEKERISREYVNLDLSISKKSNSKYYLLEL